MILRQKQVFFAVALARQFVQVHVHVHVNARILSRVLRCPNTSLHPAFREIFRLVIGVHPLFIRVKGVSYTDVIPSYRYMRHVGVLRPRICDIFRPFTSR